MQYYSNISNQLNDIWENGALMRAYSYDGAGNTVTETRPGESFALPALRKSAQGVRRSNHATGMICRALPVATSPYNKRNRLSAVTRNAVAYATYGYNALEQLTTRTTTAAGGPVGQIAYVYDLGMPRKSCRLLRKGHAPCQMARMAQGPSARGHLITEATAATGVKLRK